MHTFSDENRGMTRACVNCSIWQDNTWVFVLFHCGSRNKPFWEDYVRNFKWIVCKKLIVVDTTRVKITAQIFLFQLDTACRTLLTITHLPSTTHPWPRQGTSHTTHAFDVAYKLHCKDWIQLCSSWRPTSEQEQPGSFRSLSLLSNTCFLLRLNSSVQVGKLHAENHQNICNSHFITANEATKQLQVHVTLWPAHPKRHKPCRLSNTSDTSNYNTWNRVPALQHMYISSQNDSKTFHKRQYIVNFSIQHVNYFLQSKMAKVLCTKRAHADRCLWSAVFSAAVSLQGGAGRGGPWAGLTRCCWRATRPLTTWATAGWAKGSAGTADGSPTWNDCSASLELRGRKFKWPIGCRISRMTNLSCSDLCVMKDQ